MPPPPLPPCITSPANPVFKKLLTLHGARGIDKHREFLLGGAKLVAEAMRERPDRVAAVISVAGTPIPDLPAGACHRVLLSRPLFDQVNVMGTEGPLLSVRIPEIASFDALAAWPAGCTLFLPFSDPENIGAALRSAAGLGAARVVLLKEAACPFLPKAIRASAGAVWRLPIAYGPALAALRLPPGIPLLALDAGGHPLRAAARPAGPFGLVAGLEGQGLPEPIRQRAQCLSIPLHHGLESLNATVATAIALWTLSGPGVP